MSEQALKDFNDLIEAYNKRMQAIREIIKACDGLKDIKVKGYPEFGEFYIKFNEYKMTITYDLFRKEFIVVAQSRCWNRPRGWRHGLLNEEAGRKLIAMTIQDWREIQAKG
jgi:hypothetical protein